MKKTILLLAMAISFICLADQPNGLLPISKVAGLTPVLNGKAPINSPTFTGTVSGITPAMVGLGSVNNTSDANKPISTAVQNALNLYTTTTNADLRYNLTANNVPYTNYVYKKSQTDSLLAYKAGLSIANTFTNDMTLNGGGLIVLNGGGINCDGDVYVTNGDLISQSGSLRASTFKSSTSTLDFYMNSTVLENRYFLSTVGSDSKPSLISYFGDAAHNAYTITGYTGSILSRYLLSSAQTQITSTYTGSQTTAPVSGSIYEVTTGTYPVFDIFPTYISMYGNIAKPSYYNPTSTVLTPSSIITWTPVIGVNSYSLVPAQTETINMGTIPVTMVGSTITLILTTSGTTSYTLTFGTNIRSQGTLSTGSVSGKKFLLEFYIESTTSVLEKYARPIAE